MLNINIRRKSYIYIYRISYSTHSISMLDTTPVKSEIWIAYHREHAFRIYLFSATGGPRTTNKIICAEIVCTIRFSRILVCVKASRQNFVLRPFLEPEQARAAAYILTRMQYAIANFCPTHLFLHEVTGKLRMREWVQLKLRLEMSLFGVSNFEQPFF